MASDITNSSQNKMFKYVNMFVKDGIVRISFVQMTETSRELHEKHSRRVMGEHSNDFLVVKIFEIKKEGARDDVLSSNNYFEHIL